jgi:hypothetical protein
MTRRSEKNLAKRQAVVMGKRISKKTSMTLIVCLLILISGAIFATPAELKVNGKYLQTVSGGCTVRLTGVDVDALEWAPAGYGPPSGNAGDMTKSIAGAVNTWKANCVRIPLSQDFWFGYKNTHGQPSSAAAYIQLVDNVVNAAAALNCYVELDLHWSGTGSWGTSDVQEDMPDDNSITFWQAVANHYMSSPWVMFDLYNEPKDDSWTTWKGGGTSLSGFHTPGFQNIVKAIRDTGSRNIIVIGGLGWAWDLTGLPGSAITDTNTAGNFSGDGIMYEAHIYDNKGGSTEAQKKTLWENNVTVAVNNGYCVMIGEFGPSNAGAGNTQDNSGCTPFESDLIAWINGGNGANYLYNAMAWDFNTTAPPDLLSDWNFTATTCHGAQVKAWLAAITPPNCPGGTPTFTRTSTPANTFTFTATKTFTPTPTLTFTLTKTPSFTLTSTPVNTSTLSVTRTNTPANTATYSATQTSTATRTNTPANSATLTFTATQTSTPASTATFTSTRTNTPVITATNSPANTSTMTSTLSRTATPTYTWTVSPQGTATMTPTFTSTLTGTASSTHTFTATPTYTSSSTMTRTATDTVTPTGTQTQTYTETPDVSPTLTVTGTPPTDTYTPTFTPTDMATNTYTVTMTVTPTITSINTATNTPVNTATNTPVNTATSTPVNTATSTPVNTASNTPVNTSTKTPVNTATNTPKNTFTATPTSTSTVQTATATQTPSVTPVSTTAEPVLFPNPYNPDKSGLGIKLQLAKVYDKVIFKLYTSGFRLVHKAEISGSFTGYTSITIDSSGLKGLAPGAYYYLVTLVQKSAETRSKAAVLLIVR